MKAIKIANKTSKLQDNITKQYPKNSKIQILLVNNKDISEINWQFLKHKGSTDVIAFDLREDILPDEQQPTVAEIYICLDVAIKAAKEYKTTIGYEVLLYITHGFLHLMGGDDHTKQGALQMRKNEKIIMAKITEQIDTSTLF